MRITSINVDKVNLPLGVDPFNIDDCYRRCIPEIRTLLNTRDSGLVKAFGGVEIALWDIKGKALNWQWNLVCRTPSC